MINIHIADFNEWQVQESCSQSGSGQQQSEENIRVHTTWTIIGHICETGAGICRRLSSTSIPRSHLQAVLGSQWW